MNRIAVRRPWSAKHRARSGSSLSRDSEVSVATIYRWINQDRIDHGEKSGLSSSETIEIARTRARIGTLEDELKIARKVSTLFVGVIARAGPGVIA